jgi:hypothetical protein
MDDSTSSSSSSESITSLNSRKSGSKTVISNQIRKLIIEKLDEDMRPPKDVSILFNVNYDRVRSIYRTYKKRWKI